MLTLSTMTGQKDCSDKTTHYRHILADLKALLHGEKDLIANSANCASLLFHTMPDINWVGFYYLKGNELVLGPFQGKPACVRIAMGRGVCGTAAVKQETIVVANVNEFPGHIACDSASSSEIVLPLLVGGRLIGVLDVDSPHIGRFDADDAAGLRPIADSVLAASEC